MSWSKPVETLEDNKSIDGGVAIEKSIPKSYSLPASFHKKLKDEAKKRTLDEGRRVSASQILFELIKRSGL